MEVEHTLGSTSQIAEAAADRRQFSKPMSVPSGLLRLKSKRKRIAALIKLRRPKGSQVPHSASVRNEGQKAPQIASDGESAASGEEGDEEVWDEANSSEHQKTQNELWINPTSVFEAELQQSQFVVVRSSCVLNVLFGTVSVQGTRLSAGQTAQITIINKAPYVEVLPEHATSTDSFINDLGHEILAKVRAEKCFEPALEIHGLSDNVGPGQCPRTIHFGPEVSEKTLLLAKALNLVAQPLKVVTVLGDTKVGKTTLVNYLANYFASSGTSGSVFILDLDLGQPGCFMPGFISLRKIPAVRITNDMSWSGLEGIPAQDELICSKFVGDYSTEVLCDLFEQKLSEMSAEIKRRQLHGVLVVNTSGFVKGVGLFSTGAIVDLIQPHVLVQISKGRSDSVVRNLPNPRRFNHIESRGDFMREKITVLTLPPLCPPDAPKHIGNTREARQTAIWQYFENNCVEFTIPLSRLSVTLIRQGHLRQLAPGTPAEVIALTLVGSVCGVVISSDVEVPLLFTDCDLATQQMSVRVESRFRYSLAESTVRVYRSEYCQLEMECGSSLSEIRLADVANSEERGEDSMSELLSTYRHRVFWSGPMVGVGGKAVRRKSSKRKG